APQYTARIPFQVLPQAPAIGNGEHQSIMLNQEEASQLINRQMFLFDQDYFLSDILATSAFMEDEDHPGRPSAWVSEFGRGNTKELRKRRRVVPRMNASACEIPMTSSNAL